VGFRFIQEHLKSCTWCPKPGSNRHEVTLEGF
jgi:hypothetical protein